MSEKTILPIAVENSIKKFICQKFPEDNLQDSFPNTLLREDVLDLLDRYCTVVYYPLENEENNGFRIKEIPFSDGTRHDFVFINTAQTMEKQVFTAAHELGHIWNVEDFVIADLDLEHLDNIRESIVNRFAATLLMPSDIFSKSVRTGLKEYGNEDKKTITFANLLKLIVNLMNQFFCPMKAVILRFVELDFFQESTAEMLLGNEVIPENELVMRVNELISEFGYLKLLNPSYKKWIDGLAENLDIAEQKNLISPQKIKLMREKFGLKSATSSSPEMNGLIPLNTQEGS